MTRFRDRAGPATGTSPRTMQDLLAISRWAPDLLPALDERQKAKKRIGITVAAREVRLRHAKAIIQVARNRERYVTGNLPEALRNDVRNCWACDDPFLAMREDTRYCSAACRQWAYRQRAGTEP